MRTPYDNGDAAAVRKAHALAGAGYVCIVQDVRGRWDSEGDYLPFVAEAEDGYDTQAWIGAQPWSNGRIGMSGRSYVGSGAVAERAVAKPASDLPRAAVDLR